MDLIFLGSGAFGLPTLAALAQRHAIRAVVTQPDRPAGRGGHVSPTPIAAWATEHLRGVPIFKPQRIAELDPLPPHPLVVIAFGQKLPRSLLAARFALNLHASLLPRWRGAAPINAAILAGDRETGNSVITLADRMDAGLILGQSRRDISPTVTAGELHDQLAADGPELVLRVLDEQAAGTLLAQPQDESLVTLAPKLSKADGRVDFAQPAEACRNRIHGLPPGPGVTARLGEVDLKLCRAQAAEPASQELEPGTLADASAGLVACGGRTLLHLLEVHPAGRRRMSWADFVLGHRPPSGTRLTSRTEAS